MSKVCGIRRAMRNLYRDLVEKPEGERETIWKS
jgi:hypothetical protein